MPIWCWYFGRTTLCVTFKGISTLNYNRHYQLRWSTYFYHLMWKWRHWRFSPLWKANFSPLQYTTFYCNKENVNDTEGTQLKPNVPYIHSLTTTSSKLWITVWAKQPYRLDHKMFFFFKLQLFYFWMNVVNQSTKHYCKERLQWQIQQETHFVPQKRR